jgi:hypothetical protein
MSDKVVIDRDRLVLLQRRLENIEPVGGKGSCLHDDWVFACQNVANMLLYSDHVVARDVEPEKSTIEPSSADRYATLQDLDHAIRELRAEFRRHVGYADDGHAMRNEVRNDMAMHVDSEREYIDARIRNHIYHHHEHGGLVNEITLAEALIEYASAAQVDAIGTRLEMHELKTHGVSDAMNAGTIFVDNAIANAMNPLTDRIMALEKRQAGEQVDLDRLIMAADKMSILLGKCATS